LPPASPARGAGPVPAATLALTAQALARLEAVSRPALLYPCWHQAENAPDRLSPADLALLRPFLLQPG